MSSSHLFRNSTRISNLTIRLSSSTPSANLTSSSSLCGSSNLHFIPSFQISSRPFHTSSASFTLRKSPSQLHSSSSSSFAPSLYLSFSASSSSPSSVFTFSRYFRTSSASSSSSSSSSPDSSSSSSISSKYPNGIHLAIMGAPGVGKGTFAARISPHFSIPSISTGDLVRAEIKSNSETGRLIKSINDAGGLVNDNIVTTLLQHRLQSSDCANGFLCDGYPRRVSQALALEHIQQLDLVINIELREDILIQKAISRRVCSNCNTGYNIADIRSGDIVMPPLLPKKEGICDKCGGKLIQRIDDTEATVTHRLKTYWQETFPLLEYYEKQGILMRFQVKKGVADTPELIRKIEERLKLTTKKQREEQRKKEEEGALQKDWDGERSNQTE